MGEEFILASRSPTRQRKQRAAVLQLILLAGFLVLVAGISAAQGKPTQEEVFHSIQDSVGTSPSLNGEAVLALLGGVAALVLLLVLVNRQLTRQTTPKPLNHQNRLMREVMKATGLRAAEVKQLKAMAEHLTAAGIPVKSPVTLLLCPSLIEKARKG